jgi:hypothetical protein
MFLRFVDVAPADGWLYARGVDGPWGLKHRETVAFDVGDPAHPHRLGTVDIGWPVHVEGDYAVSIGPGAGQDDLCVVRTLDVADLAHPSVMGTVDVEGTCAEMLVAGHRAYVAAGTAVYIVDISRLDDPRVLGWMDARGEARHVAAGSEVVWVVSVPDPSDWHTRHLHAFDVSDEEAPTLIASTDLVASVAPVNQGPSEVVADGRVAWVADANRLRVLEIDSRLQLVEHASIAMNMDSDYLARDGNLLYVYGWPTETTWSVHVMDASNPRAPRPLVESGSDEWPFPSAQGMAVSPGRLRIVSFYSGIVIADTTSLAEEVPPTATGAIQTPVPTARPKPHSAFVPYAHTLRPH